MLLCWELAYGIWTQNSLTRNSDESALVVEIDFTWSLRFGSIEPGRPPIPLFVKPWSFDQFEFPSAFFPMSVFDSDTKSFYVVLVESWPLMLYDVLQVDRVLQTACNKPLPEYSLLPLVGSPLCSVVIEQLMARSGTDLKMAKTVIIQTLCF
ncbi:hypothetical protein Tco_0941364 [Tanacetum coccineum]|uniref:Uncharacterized protein n=1 Tax=Tanacetum coccineum TaxID=301880 RepID=A0ABQ5DXB9_9ASTR